MNTIWPLSVILQELKIEIPLGISQPIFSTMYNFRQITLLNSLLLRRSHSESLEDFIQSIKERNEYPIHDLQHYTKTKALFQGKLGYIELLFRGQIKIRKRVDWYNTDLRINISPLDNILYKSSLFRLHGINRADFELCYYNEIGIPFSFEESLIQRLEKTRTGCYYALLVPTEKKDRIQAKTSNSVDKNNFLYNEKYRFVVNNEKAFESVLSIISTFRTLSVVNGNGESSNSLPIKPKSIPLSVRKQVWRFYNGNVGSAPCFVCGIEITALEYECGHIHSKSTGGPNVVCNLLPICGTCNKAMGEQHLFEYAEEHFKSLSCRCFGLDSYLNWKKK